MLNFGRFCRTANRKILAWVALVVAVIGLIPRMALAELTIFDVRKNLPLSDDEKTFKDYYINGGTEAGIANGMLITVQRRLPLYDTYSNRSAGDLNLKVAKIKIIHTQKGLSVARLQSEFSRETAPLLEDNFIMVGDRLDLATAVMGKSEKVAHASSAPAPQSVETAEQKPAEALIPKGQIIVNSVEMSSEGAPQKTSAAAATPEEGSESPSIEPH
ncbi:MAG: hypothetical protein AB7F86_17465 [Bdellovibrionales bacterium]